MAKVEKFENVSSIQMYIDKATGEKKSLYRVVGRITTFDNGGKTMELYMYPGVKFVITEVPQPK